MKAVCSVFETGDNPAIQPISDDGSKFIFSMFGAVNTKNLINHCLYSEPLICLQYNHSSNGVFKVSRGKNAISDIGRILEVDGSMELDAWYSDEENQFRGTDGYFIPPFRRYAPGFIFRKENSLQS